MISSTPTTTKSLGFSTIEHAAVWTLLVFIAALQISIAVSAMLLTLTLGLWAALAVFQRETLDLPDIFWPLFAYALVTMLSVVASIDPLMSLRDSKEVLLFLVVPAVYRFARGRWAFTAADVVITVGACAAILGIVQYGILEYDNLGQRPQGLMGHYMTYSGLLMLVIGLATARLMFGKHGRMWAALVLPALVVALALTFTRSAWVGASIGVSLLLVLKDFRLLAIAPVLAAAFFVLAPTGVTDRVYSMFDLQDPTNRDRFAMARAGVRMVEDYPLTGVGPDMVQGVYGEYRDADAVNEINPHLHNVPLHIAAERGLPALIIWLWFIFVTIRTLVRSFKRAESRSLAAGGLAAIASMLAAGMLAKLHQQPIPEAAGMFEYNFGDSEFLMLFLVILTLPLAAYPGRTTRIGTSA